MVGYIKDVKGGKSERIRLLDCIVGSESLLEMLRCRFEVVDSNEALGGEEVEVVGGERFKEVAGEQTSKSENGDAKDSDTMTSASGNGSLVNWNPSKSNYVPSADVKGPLKELKLLLQNLVDRLKPRDSGVGRVIQRASWPFDREDVRGFVESIERVNSFFWVSDAGREFVSASFSLMLAWL